ncbi:MAG TPA: universal stress protein [Planctomycetaceae bacterium]|nr:universal stress protein [Planctomycetaceae bacterium]
MKCIRKILVAVEPSNVAGQGKEILTSPSQHALSRAIWLASQTGAELTIFSTVTLSPFLEDLLREQLAEGTDRPTRATLELLERCVAQAKEKGVNARPKTGVGIPWQEICREVKSEAYDLVIAGTRDLGHVGRILFGSTGMKLLRNCSAPVWITRPGLRDERFEILVPSDFSAASLEALRFALEIGRFAHGCIHLLHVVHEPIAPPVWYGYAPPQEMVVDYIAKRRAELKKRLHDQLAQVSDRSADVGVRVHIIEGQPDEAILQAIDDLNINLVVMGTAARTGVPRVVLGNTAERLVSHMRCSLVAVRSGDCPPHAPSDSKGSAKVTAVASMAAVRTP